MRWCALTLLVGSVLLAGCSTGDSTTTVIQEAAPETETGTKAELEPQAITRQQFIRKGDDVCRKFESERLRLVSEIESAQSSGDPGRLADLIRQNVVLAERIFDRLGELEVPPGDEKEVDRINRTGRELISLTSSLADAIESGDQARADALVPDQNKLAAKNMANLQGYGFRVCGSG